MSLKTDAVFEGGGVKGIGLAGAASYIQEQGYVFENLAGTSAGAIVATLLAAGYTALELKEILGALDYNRFKDEGLLDKLGILGKTLSIGFEYGIYEGDFFEDWFEGLLKEKSVKTFADLRTEYHEKDIYKYKVQVIASDITEKRLLVLPRDLESLGYDPDRFSVARAVRMSMSIPLFFEPVRLPDSSGRVHLIVDGGMLSNYPVWLLDDGTENPPWPTFGFKLVEDSLRKIQEPVKNPINNPVSFLKALVMTMIEGHDNYHISRSKGDYDRTMGIPTFVEVKGEKKAIKTTDFDITCDESEALFQNGVKAAEAFLATWNFEAWKDKYRKKRE